MHRQTLESVENARYLGIDISLDLGFSHHINRITSNAQKNLGFLKSNIKTTHSGIREAACKTIVWPQLEYASTTWSPYIKKDIYKIEMVQRRSIHRVCNLYSNYAGVTAMQSDSGLRSLEQRQVDACVIMLYKIIHGYCSQLTSRVL